MHDPEQKRSGGDSHQSATRDVELQEECHQRHIDDQTDETETTRDKRKQERNQLKPNKRPAFVTAVRRKSAPRQAQ